MRVARLETTIDLENANGIIPSDNVIRPNTSLRPAVPSPHGMTAGVNAPQEALGCCEEVEQEVREDLLDNATNVNVPFSIDTTVRRKN
ncbi:hypothetical protein E4T56_gene12202 [Termitomyces sp. T112]|nr:hypothetical protein E4T56_gene12202 [Termitomyces sp. T112]